MIDNLPETVQYPDEKPDQSRLVKLIRQSIFIPTSKRINWLLGLFTATDDGDGGEFAPGFGPVSYIDFDILYMDGTKEGRLQWNINDGTLEVGMPGGSVNLQIGQEMLVRVTNDTVTQIDNGTPVYISDASGTNIKVTPADADFAGGVGLRAFGVTTEDIAGSQKGYVTTQGFVRDIDTSFAGAAGQPAYLAVGGGLTVTKPTAPDISYLVGVVTIVSATVGELYVIQTSIPNLNSLSDVLAATADKDLLQWGSADNVYKTSPHVRGVVTFGDGIGTDASEFEADGTLKFNGEAVVWEDINLGFAGARVPAANAPSWTAFLGNLKAYTFGINDYLEFNPVELLHGYKVSSDFEFHIHWATDGTEIVDKYVQWEIEYSIANMGNPTTTGVGDVFPTPTVVSMEQMIPANTPDRTHMYLDLTDIVTGTFNIGALALFRIRRITAVTGAAPVADPFAVNIGAHYMVDTVGSRNEYTK